MAIIKFWIIQNFIAVDQAINALLFGYADETLSSRAYRTEQNNKPLGKFFRPLIDTILFFDKDHCYWAYMAEVRKRQLPREFSKL